jgi:hypothetical protein
VGDGRVVARFEGGDPAVVEWRAGKGRIFWMASGWHPRDSQLGLSSKFVPLVYGLLDLSGGLTEDGATLEVGDGLTAVTGSDRVGGAGTLIGPNGELLAGDAVADEPGTYRWVTGDKERRFAVNLTPAESRTAPLPLDEFESLGVPMQPVAEAPEVVAARLQRLQRVELEQRQRLWRWVLGGTLLLLLWESWLAARALRRGRVVGAASLDSEAQGAGSA